MKWKWVVSLGKLRIPLILLPEIVLVSIFSLTLQDYQKTYLKMRLVFLILRLIRFSLFIYWPYWLTFFAINTNLDLVKYKLDLIKRTINDAFTDATNFATLSEDRLNILDLKIQPMEIPSFSHSLIGIEHLQCHVQLTR